jgi:hypothetical protein
MRIKILLIIGLLFFITENAISQCTVSISTTNNVTELTCLLEEITLTANASNGTGFTYLWSNGQTTMSTIVTTSGTYTVTVSGEDSNGNSCSSTNNVVISANNSPPTANAGSDFTKTCVSNSSGATIGEAAVSGNTYEWSPATGLSSATVANPIASPTMTTTYIVTVTTTSTGCTATDQVTVTVNNTPPSANAGSDFTKTCVSNSSGATIGEAAVSGNIYEWSPATGLSSATVANPIANPTMTTTYIVTVTTISTGCTATDQVTVTVNNTPPSANAGSDFTKTCVSNSSGATIGEAAVSGNIYEWSPATGLSSATVANPISNPTMTTTYIVTVTTTSTGCTATDQVTVTVNNTPPSANAGSDFTKTCVSNSSGATIGEAAVSGNTYAWSPATGLSSATVANPIASPTMTTTYIVTVTTTSTGCTATDQVTVTVNNTPPSANAGSDFTKTCVSNSSGATIGEAAVSGNIYEWSPATGLSSATVANPIANPTMTTTYIVTVTTISTGCTATDQVTVTVNNTPPSANAGSDFTKTCVSNSSGATIGEAAVSGNIYAWSPATGLSSATVANPIANPTMTTTYIVTVTTISTGCTATDQVTVTVNNTPPSANAGSDFTKTCVSNSSGATIGEAAVSGNIYAWSPATGLSSATVANPIANPTMTTTYIVTVTTISTGCAATDQVTVTVNNTPPSANAGSDKELTCSITQLILSGSSSTSGTTYNWVASSGGNIVSGATTLTPTVNTAGTYTLTVTTTATGCTATDIALVTLNNTSPPIPTVVIVPANCFSNGSANVSNYNPTLNYTSNPSGLKFESGGVISDFMCGIAYTVTAKNTNNCVSSSSSFTIGCQLPSPVAAITGPSSICEKASEFFTASGGVKYLWSDETIDSVIPLAGLDDGIYTFTVTVTDTNGCTDAENRILDVKNVPNMSLSLQQEGQNAIISSAIFSNSETENISKVIYNFFNSDGSQIGTPEEKVNLDPIIRGGFTSGQEYKVEVKVTFLNGCETFLVASIILNSSDCGNFNPILKAGNISLENFNNIYKHSVCNNDSIKLNFQATFTGLTKTEIKIDNKILQDANFDNKSNINISLGLVENKINPFPFSVTYTYGPNNSKLTCNYSISIDNQLIPTITLDDSIFCYKNETLKLKLKSNVDSTYFSNFGTTSRFNSSNVYSLDLDTSFSFNNNDSKLFKYPLINIKASNNVCTEYSDTLTYRIYRTPEIIIDSSFCRDAIVKNILKINDKDREAIWSIYDNRGKIDTLQSGINLDSSDTLRVSGYLAHSGGPTCNTDTVKQHVKVKPLPSAKISSYTKDCGPFYKVDSLSTVTNQNARYTWKLGNDTTGILNIFNNKQIIGVTGSGILSLTQEKDGCYDHDTIPISVSTNFIQSLDTIQNMVCNDSTLFYLRNFKDGECYRWMYINLDGDIKEINDVDKPYVKLNSNNQPLLVKFNCNTPCSGSIVTLRSTESDHDCNDGQDLSKQSDPLEIRPNPAFDLVELYSDFKHKGNYDINVYDISGRQKVSLTLIHDGGGFMIPLDVSEWQAGMYIVTMGTETQKLIVIK